MSFALSPFHGESVPGFPDSLSAYHSKPFVAEAPATFATSPAQLERKSKLWPVAYFPTLEKAKREKEWTTGEIDWVRRGLETCLNEATRLWALGQELPIAAYVSPSYEGVREDTCSSIAHDTRRSTSHPLRHACMNIIRHVAETQASTKSVSPADTASTDSSPHLTRPATTASGPSYLLTAQTLFVTHEPCIMCTMALLHSRVKDVFYLFPMEKTGGLGATLDSKRGGGTGLVRESVPGLKGVNHRFGIWRWTGPLRDIHLDNDSAKELLLYEALDA